MLKNPHPLGLEVKIAEQEQVVADNEAKIYIISNDSFA